MADPVLSDVLVNVGITPFDGTGDSGQVPFSKYNKAVTYLFPNITTLTANVAANTLAAAAANTAAGTATTAANAATAAAGTATTNAATALAQANAAIALANTYQTAITANTNASGSRRLALSAFPNIYPDQPLVDSYTGIKAAFAAIALARRTSGISYTLVWDCSVLCSVNTDYTRPLFIEPYTFVDFEGAGQVITDNVGIPTFVFAYCQGCIWNGLNVSYRGAGAPIDHQALIPSGARSYNNNSGAFNTTTLTNYMKAGGTCPDNRVAITFTGQTAIWPGDSLMYATIMFTGDTHNNKFTGSRFTVPPGTTANLMNPWLISGTLNWLAGTSVTSSTTANIASTSAIPYCNEFNDTIMDGFLMGVQGTGMNFIFNNTKMIRYSDLQNVDGSQIGGLNAVNSAYPSTNPWFPPPHGFYIPDPDASFYAANPLYTNRSIKQTYDYGVPVGFQMGRRTTNGSGTCCSFKGPLANDMVIDDYTSLRPDGFADVITYVTNNKYGTMKNVYASFDSSLPVITEQQGYGKNPIWGLRFPAQLPYVYAVMTNITIRDKAATSFAFPVGSFTNTNNANCSLTGFKVYVNDWSGTDYCGFGVAGTNMEVDCAIFFNSYSATTTARGCINQGAGILQQSTLYYRMYGFRSPIITFVSYAGNSGLLNTPWVGGSTNNYVLNFSDASVRYATLTNGSTAVSWQQALNGTAFTFTAIPSGTTATLSAASALALGTGTYNVTINGGLFVMNVIQGACTFTSSVTTATTVNATITGTTPSLTVSVGGLLIQNYTQLKNRLAISGTGISSSNLIGAGFGNVIKIDDITNQYFESCLASTETDTWAFEWTGSPTGMNFQIPTIILPSAMAIVAATWSVSAAPLGTSQNAASGSLGWSGAQNAITTSMLPVTLGLGANTVTGAPVQAPLSSGGTQRNIILSANVGTAWNVATAYVAGNKVFYLGVSYICATANTGQTPPNATYWTVNLSAAWSSATAYVAGNKVSLNGQNYIAIASSTNQTPPNTTYWNVDTTADGFDGTGICKVTLVCALVTALL